MILTDTHTHLYSEQFKEDIDEVVQKAINLGVSRFFLPNIDSGYTTALLALAKKYPDNMFPMTGLHPCSVKADYQQELEHVEKMLSEHKVVAIGEIGIDLYWDKTFFKEQQIAFRHQIRLAKANNLPFVIHCRDAFDEIFEILDEENDENMCGIFHCFTGNLEQAQKIINYGGFKLGIGGVVTFKNAGLDKVVEQLELEHLVLETDAPYLAPVPYRGKRNESAYIIEIATKIADLKQVSIEEVAKITTANSKTVFGV
ncbi:MAG: TatD family hydrolase [Flavobacteriales bacterium]|nr:TatD family hydrolase [Flavobacteriales bacterium]MCW8913332.1 TatD family hydrolase [Flavobacteriales bacterium]MCW8936934.1 TatD family hydrolase [Flavobacteriales bacterium]MCW8968605.1 TatD family hydrolase [Flavobacteriales bacterium]MCW8990308.1 TatD family hydrolase [Flavobacteriales bacterium]